MGGYEFETTNLRFSYSSMTTPSEVYDYDMAKRTRVLRKRQEIPSGHDPADYVTTRIMAKSHDGAEVPVSILHRRDLRATATRRCCSTATAPTAWRCRRRSPPTGCRWSIAASSMPSPISAAAPTRAGAGTSTASARRRPTRFDDFAAAGRALIEAKYTAANRIVGHGGSAGGMLMGAVANRAGELFAGIVAEVPFVDVLNTMLDDTLPLTPPEWPEWGNPIESETDFQDHPVLFALRQCRGEGLSGNPGDGRPHRSARHLLGAGQMDRAAARRP